MNPDILEGHGKEAGASGRLRMGVAHAKGHAPSMIALPVAGNRSSGRQPRFMLTPAKLVEAVLHRWKLAVFCGSILAAAGFALAWVTYVPKFTSTASMRMESGEWRLLAKAEDRHSNGEDEFRRTQALMIKSRRVLDEVVKRDAIRGLSLIRKSKDPVMWLERDLQASFINGTSIFRASLSGEIPEEVAVLVNEITEVFKSQYVDTVNKDKLSQYKLISDAVDLAEKKIMHRREDFINLATSLRSGDSNALTLKQRMALEEYGTIRREFLSNESEIRRLESQVSVLRAALKAHDSEKLPPALVDDTIDRNPKVQSLRFEINALKARVDEYQKAVKPDNPRLSLYREEIAAAEAKLQKTRTEVEPEAVRQVLAENRHSRSIAVDQAVVKLEFLAKERSALLKEVTVLGAEAEKIGLGMIELDQFRSQIAETEGILKKLRAEKEQLDFERTNTMPTIVIDSPAIASVVNQSPFYVSASMYSIAGLLVGLFGISFLEARTLRLHQPVELKRDLGIDMLGVVPKYDSRRRMGYGRALAAASATVESPAGGVTAIGMPAPLDVFSGAVNHLCATILCDDRLSHKSVLMITSAREAEGKTLLATQLAAGFSRAGRKTLLLDCDFRDPRCHERFGLPIGNGLSEILRGEIEVADAMQTVPGCDARFLSAGASDQQVMQSLSNGTFAKVLAGLHAEFDCVIVDSAPTLLVPDGLMIGKLVDGVILVVRSKISTAPNVFAAYEQLVGLNIRILGAVVNGIPATASRYYRQ
jgi:polysaccharide biosynthesis transport protein